jgi:hypothetical protein
MNTISVTAAQAIVLTQVLILLIQLVILMKLRLRNPHGFKSPAGTLMRTGMLTAVFFSEIYVRVRIVPTLQQQQQINDTTCSVIRLSNIVRYSNILQS